MAKLSAAFSRTARQWFKNLKLSWAAACGDSENVRALLAAGANVHAEQEHALLAAVRAACSSRQSSRTLDVRMNTIRALLEAGADVHARGDRAVRIAASQGRTEVARMLLDAGADIHALNYWEARRLTKAYELDVLAKAVADGDAPGGDRRSAVPAPDKN